MPVLRSFSVSDGVIAGERIPEEPDQLYATAEELGSLFGIRITEASIRFAMSLIHAYCNRPSLWPIEVDFPVMRLPEDRMQGRIPLTPVIQITEASGRFAYAGRRDRQGRNAWYWGYAPILALQGSAPTFLAINTALIQCDPATGIFSLPWSGMLLPWNEVKIRAIVGYVEIPPRIKTAIAEIANSVQSRGVSDRVAYTVGRISRKYAPGSNTFISPQAEQLLQPFVVQSLF
jgi:hypothetical protein